MRDVVEENLDELDFLWELRESVLFAPDWTLSDLNELEQRAEAHLDALRLSGDVAVDLALPLLGAERKFAVFAGARTLLESPSEEVRRIAVDALEKLHGPALDGLRLALRFASLAGLESRLMELLERSDPGLELVIVDVLSFQRRPVRQLSAAERTSPMARELAWRVRGRQRSTIGDTEFLAELSNDDGAARRAALEAAARVGLPGLVEACRAAAKRAASNDIEAIEFLGVAGSGGDVPDLAALVARGGAAAGAALRALGASGRVDGIASILSALEDSKLAPTASAAFVRIAGGQRLLQTVGVESPERELDGSTAATPVAVPAVLARRHWDAIKSAFSSQSRVQAGVDIGSSGVPACVDALPLAVRRDLHLAAAASAPQTFVDVELEHLALRQRLGK
jgi:uncharacterized protein (TIGR02270 family)